MSLALRLQRATREREVWSDRTDQEPGMTDAADASKNQPPGYVPPKVWKWDAANGGQFHHCEHDGEEDCGQHEQCPPRLARREQALRIAVALGVGGNTAEENVRTGSRKANGKVVEACIGGAVLYQYLLPLHQEAVPPVASDF